MLLAGSFGFSKSYARYTSQTSDEDEIRVAKFGKLTLIEKLNGEVQENDLDLVEVINTSLELGNDIDKEVYLEFVDSEVSTYLFLVIDSVNWIYDDNYKEFNVINNNSHLLSFNINDKWSYLDKFSNDNRFVFYYEYVG